MSETKQIVLARVVNDIIIIDTTGIDLGHTPKTKVVKKAETCMWLRKGQPTDIQKAKDYARSTNDGWGVFLIDSQDRDPLGTTKALVLAKETDR